MRTLVFFLPLVIYSSICVASLPDKNIQFINYGIGDGLSQSTVLTSYQDSHGFLWFGTRDGLNLFNGYEFKIFRNQPGDSLSIIDNHINYITGDKYGNLWIASNEGLSLFNYDFSYFNNYQLNQKGTAPEITAVHINDQNRIWVGTKDGIFTFEKESGRFYKEKHPVVQAVAENYVTAIFVDSQKNIWIGTTRGLFLFEYKNQEIKVFLPENEQYKITHHRVEAIAEDHRGKIWVGTYGGGVTQLDESYHFQLHLHQHDSVQRLPSNFIRCLVFDQHQNLWIGTFDGLAIYKCNEEKTVLIEHDFMNKNGLNHGSIRSLLADDKGSIWIGTYMGGISYYDQDNQKFQHNYHVPNQQKSLSHNVVSDFSQDKDGNYYIGTERGGLNYYHAKANVFTQISNTKGRTIKSLLLDEEEYLWVGTFKNGLQRYNTKFGELSRTFTSSNFPDIARASINDILDDRRGFLWLATDKHGGIFKFDKKTLKFSDFELQDTLHSILANNRVMSIMQDYLGNIWLSTYGEGLIIFNEAEKKIIQYKAGIQLQGINSNDINHTFADKKNRIWVATNGGGISLFNRQKETFSPFTTRDGLQNNSAIGISEDDEGNLWISCINGVSKFDPEEKSFRNFNFTNGLPLQEINEGAFYKDNSSNLLIGGSNGFIKFNPENIQNNQYIPPVKITNFKLFNQSILPGKQQSLLQNHIINTHEIILKHHQSIFTVEFVALSYLKPEQNHYMYRLQGLEENWNYVGNSRSASYTNLKEGKYTFMVKAANNDQQWNLQPTNLSIVVKPPFWKSWWAIMSYIFIIISGLSLIRYISNKSARMKSEIQLRELENAKLQEIHNLKLQSFTDVSHEFRTPLTLIIDPLEQVMELVKEDYWVKKQLNIMHSNARRLLLLINQILEISELESGITNIKTEPTHLPELIKNICESFAVLAQKHNLTLKFEHNFPDLLIDIDRDKMEKIIYNLLSNAIKFNKPNGYVLVTLSLVEKNENDCGIKLKIEDTGIGIKADIKERVFERFYKGRNTNSTGVGLSLTKSLVEVMGGNIDLMSTPKAGTTFVVSLSFAISRDQDKKVEQLLSKALPVEYLNNVIDDENDLDETAELNNQNNGKSKILLVEDDADLKIYLKENLNGKFDIITAKNGVKGLEKAKKANPDLMISDVMMPKMDGITLCQKIKTNPKLCHIPVILLTAKTKDAERLKGLESGADDYLSKPFILHELLIRINNLLNSRKQLKNRYSKDLAINNPEIQLNSYDEELLEKINNTIRENIENTNLNVDFLGDQIGMSRVHLYRKLKVLTGLSPSDLIKSTRMKMAAQMLQQNKVNVSEVAYRAGFQDQHYFRKVFKKQFGMSPTEYCQNNKENLKNA